MPKTSKNQHSLSSCSFQSESNWRKKKPSKEVAFCLASVDKCTYAFLSRNISFLSQKLDEKKCDRYSQTIGRYRIQSISEIHIFSTFDSLFYFFQILNFWVAGIHKTGTPEYLLFFLFLGLILHFVHEIFKFSTCVTQTISKMHSKESASSLDRKKMHTIRFFFSFHFRPNDRREEKRDSKCSR